MATSKMYLVTKSTSANGAVLILVAIFLGAIVVRGNVGSFMSTVWNDITGQTTAVSGGAVTVTAAKGPAFWQWAIAVVILIALAENDSTSGLFAPFLGIMVIAMLIQLATRQPQLFKDLSAGITSLLGGT